MLSYFHVRDHHLNTTCKGLLFSSTIFMATSRARAITGGKKVFWVYYMAHNLAWYNADLFPGLSYISWDLTSISPLGSFSTW